MFSKIYLHLFICSFATSMFQCISVRHGVSFSPTLDMCNPLVHYTIAKENN